MLKELDTEYNNDVVGVDECGRGNFAGSLYICGVKLKDNCTINDISFANDSKKLSKSQRILMVKEILKYVDYELVEYKPKYIDVNGLSAIMTESLLYIKKHFGNKNRYIFDGKADYKSGYEMFIKGDSRSSLIAAASIIGKVKKDYDMLNESKKYPEYGFEGNSGYGTAKHIEAIKKYGYTPLHRRSFNVKALKDIDIKEYKN